MIKNCKYCNKEYTPTFRIKKSKFCSQKCFHSWSVGRFVPWNKGLTKEIDERVKRTSELLKGRDVGFGKGCHHSNESKKIISNKLKEYYKDSSRHSNWLGGISYEPYGLDFNKSLKKKVYERDNYYCQLCMKKLKIPQTHHIDYNKTHNIVSNLISLCRSCHGKTNFNRYIWKEILNNILIQNEKIINFFRIQCCEV